MNDLNEKMIDVLVPGCEVEVLPDEAEELGFFTEDALSAEEARESQIDLVSIDSKGGDKNGA